MLSCSCSDWYDWWYLEPDNFTKFQKSRRKRCISCKELINIGSDCIEFNCYTHARSDIEERIYGDEVPMADKFMCEKCGEIFLNLSAIGYCLEIGHDIREDLEDYWDITGFIPKPKE